MPHNVNITLAVGRNGKSVIYTHRVLQQVVLRLECRSGIVHAGEEQGLRISRTARLGLRGSEPYHPYVFLDGLWLKRSWGGEVRNVSLLVAIGVNKEGFREVLAVAEGAKEDRRAGQHFCGT